MKSMGFAVAFLSFTMDIFGVLSHSLVSQNKTLFRA